MYNPLRQVVQAEAQRIKGEFGNVDSTGWVRPAKKKNDIREVWSDAGELAKFLVGSMALGGLIQAIPFVHQSLEYAPVENRIAVMAVTGVATLSLCSLVVGLVRLKISPRQTAEEQKTQESDHAE